MSIKEEFEAYEDYYNKLMHIFYLTRIGLGKGALIATIKNDDDYALKLMSYIELRRKGFTANEILEDVKKFPSKEDIT